MLIKSLLIILLSIIFLLTEVESNNNDLWDVRKTKNVMDGLQLRVATYELPPLFSVKKNRNGSFYYEGTANEFLNVFSDYFNLKISYIHSNQSEIERFGTPFVMLRMLVENEIDLISFPMERKLSHSERADLLFPFWVANYALMQPWPEEESRLTIPIRPFSLSIWIIVLASMFTFIGFASILFVMTEQRNSDIGHQKSLKTVLFDQLQYVVSILTLQGSSLSRYNPSNRLAVRVFIGSWLLAMLVLVYAYRGVLMSILFVPKLKPIIENWDQLADQHEFKLTTDLNSTLTQLFMAMQVAYFFISKDLKANHNKCRVTAGSKGLMYYMSFHLAVIKDSPYTEIINRNFMLYFVETGLTNFVMESSKRSDRPCRTDVKPTGKMSAFNLKDFAFAFFLFGIGVGISLFTFILELMVTTAAEKFASSAGRKKEKSAEA